MIINHKHELIIIHDPKCAEKLLREHFSQDLIQDDFWHWRYSKHHTKWLDMAHLLLITLKEFPE